MRRNDAQLEETAVYGEFIYNTGYLDSEGCPYTFVPLNTLGVKSAEADGNRDEGSSSFEYSHMLAMNWSRSSPAWPGEQDAPRLREITCQAVDRIASWLHCSPGTVDPDVLGLSSICRRSAWCRIPPWSVATW